MPSTPLNRSWTTDGQSASISAHIGMWRRRLGKVRPGSAGKSAFSMGTSRPGSAGVGASRPGSSGIGAGVRPSIGMRPSSSGTLNSSRVLFTRQHARTGSNVGVRHMRIGSGSSLESVQAKAPDTLTTPPELEPPRSASEGTGGRPDTPPRGAFQMPVAGSRNDSGGSRREDHAWNYRSRTEEDLRYRQGNSREPAEVPSHRDPVRNDPIPTDQQNFQINCGSDTASSRNLFFSPNFSPVSDGSALSRVHLTRFDVLEPGAPSRKGLELVRPRTSPETLVCTSTSLDEMGLLNRSGTGPIRTMTFPRAVMSDVELRTEWSSNEDARSLRTLKLSPRKPRWTVEADRPRRSQSERSRRTVESERSPRPTTETDRPSVDQRRFPSLLRVRERTRVNSAPSEPDEKPKRGSWLASLRFRSNPSSRAPTPTPAPAPSLSPISSSPLGPIFYISPATPGGNSIFGTGDEEGVCSQPVPEPEPWSRVTAGSGWSEHEPRMLSRASSGKAIPPRPPQPSRPIPSTPEFILPDDRRQREATIRPSSRSRPPSATEFGLNGDPYGHYDKPSFLDELDVASESDYYGEEVPPGTATTADEPRIAGTHRAQLSISSRVPISESNVRWSAAGRSRSNSGASASQWRGASVYLDDEQDDEARYGLPSPCANADQDPDDGVMSNGEYGGIVGPRRDLYSDDELESVLEENESDCDHDREDRTAAMIIADEGRGLIVDAEARPLSQLDVQTGTTHLLLGNTPNPSNVAAFLTQVLPQISTTLLCLDISNNELASLPPALSSCIQLEELNVSHNPLRSLPSSLGALVSLRVLIADACELQSLPSQLVNLGALHSLSVRSNRLVMLPVWMCAMPGLEVLKIEGNTFAGPWRNLVEPLLPRDTSYTPPPNHVYTAARAANSLPLLSTNTSNGSLLASPISLGRPGGVQRSYSQQPDPAIDPRWNTVSPLPSPYPISNSAPHSPPRSALSPPPTVMMSPPPATGLAHLQLPIQSPPTTAAKLNMHLGALAPTPRRKKKRAGGGSISGSEIMTTDAESEVEARQVPSHSIPN